LPSAKRPYPKRVKIFQNGKLFVYSGVILIGVGFILLLYLFIPIIAIEVSYLLNKNSYNTYQVAQTEDIAQTMAIIQNVNINTIIIPKSTQFGLIIPKLNINEDVYENVDPFNKANYNYFLTKGVAQAKGSGLPGSNQGVFIFAHSARDFLLAQQYNAQFYLLNNLGKDDLIYVYYQNQEYKYQVTSKEVVNPDITSVISTIPQNELILMTCYPAGLDAQRLLVRARIY